MMAAWMSSKSSFRDVLSCPLIDGFVREAGSVSTQGRKERGKYVCKLLPPPQQGQTAQKQYKQASGFGGKDYVINIENI